jgi:uncharacterized YccA/Bax inhibitor family protein
MPLNAPTPSSNNPAWRSLRNATLDRTLGDTLTRSDIAVRTAFLLLACIGGAAAGWLGVVKGFIPMQSLFGISIACGLTYLVLGLIISFKPLSAQYLATPAVTVQGVTLGLISMLFDARYHGIASMALMATLSVGVVSWAAYSAGMIKPTQRFISIVQIATISVAVLYAVNFALAMFVPGNPLNGFFYSNSLLSIGFSLLMIGLASANLVVDYAQADSLIEQRAPRAFAWIAAWAVTVTLIWLYIEVLRLLAKLNSRR